MIPTTARALLAATSVAASGASSTLDLLPATGVQDDTLRLNVATSALAAGCTLTVGVQTSDDNGSWRLVGQTVTITAIGTTPLIVAPVQRYVQITYALAGDSPSATLAVAGVSTRPYINLGDLASQRLLGQVYASVLTVDLDSEVMTACGRADDLLSDARYNLPLIAWGQSLKDDLLAIVAWNVMSNRVGFNPEGDTAIRQRFTDAIANLKRGSYADIVDSEPLEDDGGIFVDSEPQRGWGRWR